MHDLDLVIRLVPDSIRSCFRALGSLGYSPSVPVTAEGFADAAQRAPWIAVKGVVVLNFQSDQHSETPLNIFVTEPFELAARRSPDARELADEIGWSATTFEGNRRRQHQAFFALSFREKVERLEQMSEVVAVLRQAQRLVESKRVANGMTGRVGDSGSAGSIEDAR